MAILGARAIVYSHRVALHRSQSLIPSTFSFLSSTGKGKPRGLQAARKLRTTRRENRWADKHYKKQALGTAFRFSPFGGSSHAKGIVLEKMYVFSQDCLSTPTGYSSRLVCCQDMESQKGSGAVVRQYPQDTGIST